MFDYSILDRAMDKFGREEKKNGKHTDSDKKQKFSHSHSPIENMLLLSFLTLGFHKLLKRSGVNEKR